MSNLVIPVTAANGVTFNVRVVQRGERYGATNSMTATQTLVEFYDQRYPHTVLGQFITRYHLTTLLDDHPRERGLDLHGGEPSWKIDANALRLVQAWLREVTAEPAAVEIETRDRSYSVGIPLAITLREDGSLVLDLDLAEAGDEAESCDESIDQEIWLADTTHITEVLDLAKNHIALTVAADGTVTINSTPEV